MMLRLLPGRNSHNILHFGIVYIVCFWYFNISGCPAYEFANNSNALLHMLNSEMRETKVLLVLQTQEGDPLVAVWFLRELIVQHI